MSNENINKSKDRLNNPKESEKEEIVLLDDELENVSAGVIETCSWCGGLNFDRNGMCIDCGHY